MKSRASLEEKLVWIRQRQAKRAACEEVGAPPPERQISFEKARQQKAPERLRMRRPVELAREYNVSPQSIRRWFRDQAVIVTTGTRKRPHRTFLIPQEAVDDWERRNRAR